MRGLERGNDASVNAFTLYPLPFLLKKCNLKGKCGQYKCSVPISPLRSVSSSRPNFTNSLLVGLNPLSLNASPSSSIDIAPLRERCGEIVEEIQMLKRC